MFLQLAHYNTFTELQAPAIQTQEPNFFKNFVRKEHSRKHTTPFQLFPENSALVDAVRFVWMKDAVDGGV